jgi:hypothetical protein
MINRKKKRRPAEANRHLPVNSKSLIELLTIGIPLGDGAEGFDLSGGRCLC